MRAVDLRLLFFFFQAEDGIRDDLVTGVQTCALPILSRLDSSGYERPARGSPHSRIEAQLDQLVEGRGAAGDEYGANKRVKERRPREVCKRSGCTHPKAGSDGERNEKIHFRLC